MAETCLSGADAEYTALIAEAFENWHYPSFDAVGALDRTPRLLLADWLEDHGRQHEAECLRWATRFEPAPRHPYHNRHDDWTWMSSGMYGGWRRLWSALPPPLFDALADDISPALPGYKAYNSVAEAFAALLAAWPVALAKGWRPEGQHV